MSKTVTDVVIYARYSSHSQNETSIEGQLKVCYDFCNNNDYRVIHEYIDRALSGRSDDRPAFQQMIEDSSKEQFKYVIVYQLDRFSRNRYDSAIYKNKLKKHGIRVLSAKENITDDASGILMESVLEGMAEYYSAELKQKICRGMTINAEKCLYLGGNLAYGYKINPDKTYSIDPDASKVVEYIFKQYANGATIANIVDALKERGIRNNRGDYFAYNSICKLLRNEKYIGTYKFKDIIIPNGIPRIISDELFQRVADKFEKKKHAPAANRDVQYILSGKLICGHCQSNMVGYGGTSRSKKRYYYYICNNRPKHICNKEYVKKELIEELVLDKCRELLDDDIIDKLVEALVQRWDNAFKKSELALLEKRFADVNRKINNLTKAIIDCDIDSLRKNLYNEMPILEEERKNIEKSMSECSHIYKKVNPEILKKFLLELRDGSYSTDKAKQGLINAFVNKVYLYDDKMTIFFNTGDNKEIITKEMLTYVQDKSANQKRSDNNSLVEHRGKYRNIVCFTYCFAITYEL